MKTKTSAAKTLNTLIVDNDAARRAELVEVVKNCGYDVAEADSVEAAKAMTEREVFHVIMCRDMLENISGVTLLKWLRPEKLVTAFILLTEDEAGLEAKETLAFERADVFVLKESNYSGLFPKLAAIQGEVQAAEQDAKTTVHPVRLAELQQGTVRGERANVDLVMDIPISISVRLGSTTMLVQELLQLGPGSVVELDKRAGEPVEIFVNDKLLAVGEVVVVDGTFGVRIAEIVDPKQRVQALS